jgi:hypothetical protein
MAASALGFGALGGVHHAMEAPQRARIAATDQAAQDAKTAEANKAAQQQAEAERQQKVADPEYQQQTEQAFKTATEQRKGLAEEAKNIDPEDPNAAELKAAAEERVRAFDEQTMQPATDAYKEAYPALKAAREAKAKADSDAAAAAEAKRQADLQDPQVQAGLQAQMAQAHADHAQAVNDAVAARQSGDTEAARAAEVAVQQHIATIRDLQPKIAPPPAPVAPAPAAPPPLDIAAAQKRLKTVTNQYANALRTGELDVAAQHGEEMDKLQAQVTAHQQATAELAQRQDDLKGQNAPIKATNPMAAFDEQSQAIAKDAAQGRTDKDVADMGTKPVNTGSTRQQDLYGGTQTVHPQKITADALDNRISRVPDNIAPGQKFLLSKLQDNLDAVAADPEKATIAADWLHRLSLGNQTVVRGVGTEGNASRDIGGYREKDVAAMLAEAEQGKRSETQQQLNAQYRPLTPEQKTALVGTQGYHNRTVTPEMVPTRSEPVQRAVQTDLAPQERHQGKLFPTKEAFQKFLGSETLYKARVLGGQAVQTLSRVFQKLKPLEARIAQLERAGADAQANYQRTADTNARGMADANSEQAGAQARLKALTDKLDKELQPLQIQWMEARNALKAAVENSFDIADKLYQNAARFEMVKGDAMDAMKAVVDAKERLVKAVEAPVSKAAWDEMRAAQTAIPVAEAFFETHRAAMPEEIGRFLKADRALNAQLEQAVKVEGQLREAHDSAREALDRLAANQQRRNSVKTERADAETALQAATARRDTATQEVQGAKTGAANAAEAADIAKRSTAAQKNAALNPVLKAQKARTAVPEKERVTLAGRKQGLLTAQTKATEAAQENLPGRSVDSAKRRQWLNELDDAERSAKAARAAFDGAVTTSDRNAAADRLAKANVDVSNAKRQLGEKEIATEAIDKKIATKEALIEKLRGSDKGGADEPGIPQKIHDSRIKELTRARAALEKLQGVREKHTGVKVTEKGEDTVETGRAEDEESRIADAMDAAYQGLEDAQHEGNARKVAFFKHQLELLVDGKLPPRVIGPLVKPAIIAGNSRTGSPESVAGDMKTSPKTPVTQSGTRRGVTAHQAVEEGNRVSAEREAARLAEERQSEEAAKDKAAVEEANNAPKMTEEEQAAMQEELDAELDKENDRAVFRTIDQSGAGSTVDEVTRLKDRIVKGWTNVPEIEVVATEADLPQHLRDQMAKDGVEGAVPGLMDTKSGKVYLVAEHLHNGNDVALTIAHEVVGHHGLRSMLGDTYRETMRRLYEGNAAIREVADARMRANKGMEQGIAVEEALAEMAEKPGKPSSALMQVFHAVKQWLAQKLGIKHVSDAEVQQIVANARKHVMAGKPDGSGGGGKGDGKAVYRTATAEFADSIIAKPVPFKDRIKDNFGLRFETKYVDMRAPTIKALRAAGSHALQNASYLIRKADARMAHTFAVMAHGALGVRKDAKGLTVIEAGNSKSAKDVFDAVAKVKGKDAPERMATAQVYLTAKRAARVGWDKLGFDPAHAARLQKQAAAMMAEVNADPVQKAALENVAKVYGDLNRGLIDFMAASGRISKAEAARLTQHNDYVPFYRIMKDGTAVLDLGEGNVYPVGNIRNQPYLQALKGGDQQLLPLNEAVARNVTMMTDMAMRNMATKDVAYALQSIGKSVNQMKIRHGDGPASGHVLRFYQEPDPKLPGDNGKRYLTIDTEGTAAEGVPSDMLAQSLEGSFATLPDFLKAASWFGDVLRSGVTRNPMYIARQLIRDPMAATFTGGMDKGILRSVFKSVGEFGGQMRGTSKTGAELVKKGLIHSNIFTGDSDDMGKMAMQLASGNQSAWHQFIAGWDHAAMKADGATRATMYDSARRQGLSEQEAEMAAMEMMNFNKRGLSPSVQHASRMIPFFNAQIQGLNVLYKAATGKMPLTEQLKIKEKFFRRAMLMAGATLAYAAAMDDDKTYKEANASTRYNYWLVPNPTGGEHFKIPIPFEVGILFKMLPEAMLDAVKGKSSQAEWNAIKQALVQQIPGGNNMGLPQVSKPLIEVMTNHDFYTGDTVEPASKSGLDPSQRFTKGTTEAAKAFSRLLESQPIDALKLSPAQIEHLTRGYLGSLPLAVAKMTNHLFDDPARVKNDPETRASENPIYGVAFQKENGGGAVERAYIEEKALVQAKATFDNYLRMGDKEGAKAYRERAIDALTASGAAKGFSTTMTALRNREDMLRRTVTDPVQLRVAMDKLDTQREDMANRFLKVVERVKH